MWVPIALSRDVPKGVTRGVILAGRELVVWRTASGSVQAWEDRCPHRGMRLSLGFVRGETLNCLYHGWQYGQTGSCQRIPAHPDLVVPPTITANVYPSTETGGFIVVNVEAEPGPPPLLLAGRPIASLAIDAPVDRLRDLAGGTPLHAFDGVSTVLDGVSINLGWHAVTPGKVMLHAVAVDPGDVETRVLRALHRLRADSERKAVA
jgi:phenylpropionate dioxygenase-like ring-hydroxylating dioxygenase large terminal subunit